MREWIERVAEKGVGNVRGYKEQKGGHKKVDLPHRCVSVSPSASMANPKSAIFISVSSCLLASSRFSGSERERWQIRV